MLQLVLLALFLHATTATTTNAHFSEALKIKCQALPFRSVYLEASCYFAIDVNSDGAVNQCPTVLAGSKFTGNAPDAVWRSLFVDKSQFLQDADSKDKKALCIYESKFKCSTGLSTSIPGKCTHNGDKKMNYRQAETFCDRIGSLPSPQNDAENRIVAATTKSPVWLRPSFSKTWLDRTDFSRFVTCAASPFVTASDPQLCSSTLAVAANPDGTSGYWALAGQTNMLDVLCVGDAASEFWTDQPKPKRKPKEDCKSDHEWNDKNWRCEWTGPPEACVQLFRLNGKTQYIRIPNYPNTSTPAVRAQLNQFGPPNDLRPFEDTTQRVVVRRGCMANFYSHWNINDVRTEMKLLKNVEYGDYFLPTAANGALEGGQSVNGLSLVSCVCDPYETEKEKPAKTTCVDHHQWSMEKERCVWKLDENIAGEIESHEGKKMMLEIPNWPYNKIYDVNFNYASLPDFMYKVTRIIVRQGCFCTIYSGPLFYMPQTRTTVNYGSHEVASKFGKNPLAKLEQGSLRVHCECMNGDSGKDRLIRVPEAPKCIDMHAYNEKTKRCEWTGPEASCAKLTNSRNQTITLDFYKTCGNGKEQCIFGITRFFPFHLNLMSNAAIKLWDRQLTGVTVRRGCIVDVFVAHNQLEATHNEYKIIANAKYGTYRVPQKMFGDVEGGYVNHLGGNQANCVCDRALLSMTSAPPTTPCLEGHKYDERTGQCEWTRDKRICAVVSNDKGETIDLVIENWPVEATKSWNIYQSRSVVPNATLFVNRVTSVLVRQHCYVGMYTTYSNFGGHTLAPTGYGIHKPARGTVRVLCSCLE